MIVLLILIIIFKEIWSWKIFDVLWSSLITKNVLFLVNTRPPFSIIFYQKRLTNYAVEVVTNGEQRQGEIIEISPIS